MSGYFTTPAVGRVKSAQTRRKPPTRDGAGVGFSPSLNPTDAITVEAWYKPTVSFIGDGDNSIVDKGYSSYLFPYYQYHLGVVGDYIPAARFQFVFDVSVGGILFTLDTPTNFWVPGNWYHLAGTYDGSAVHLYVNGALISSAPFSG